MSSVTVTTPKFRGRIVRRMALLVWLLTLIPVGILAGVFALYQRQALPNLTAVYLIAGFLLVLYLGLVWGILHFLLKPILLLTETYRLFADGNWEVRLPVNRNDELGLLAFSFNRLADEMAILYRQLEALRARRERGLSENPEGTGATEPAPEKPTLPAEGSRWSEKTDQATSTLSALISAIGQAETAAEILSLAQAALRQTPYSAVLLLPETATQWRVRASAEDPATWVAELPPTSAETWQPQTHLPYTLPAEALQAAFEPRLRQSKAGQSGQLFIGSAVPLFSDEPEFASLPPETAPLVALPLQLQCRAAAFIPAVRLNEAGQPSLAAVLLLGARDEQAAAIFTPDSADLQPYIALLELITSALRRIEAQKATRQRLEELQAITRFSRSIAVEADLESLFNMLSSQVTASIGEVSSVALALYDAQSNTIRIPFLKEHGELLNVPPFPLGEGLTSIVIRTRQPLMIVENMEEQAQALGARLIGEMPKSWLGVPLIFGGEVIGALIVQDNLQEKRFTQYDCDLLVGLSAHLAAVVRNTLLLENARRLAENERRISEIASRIRRSPDLQTVLQTTAVEIGTALRARRAHIEIKLEE